MSSISKWHPSSVLLLTLVLLGASSSCSKIGTTVSKFFAEEGAELTTKKLLKEAGEELAEEGTERTSKQLLKAGAGEMTEASARKLLLEGTSEAAEKAAAKGGRTLASEASELTLENVPRGRKSLAVVQQADGSFSPAINNLNKHAGEYADDVNKALFAERRKALTPSHQFATETQIEASSSTQRIAKAGERNHDVLRENIYRAMDPKLANISKGFGGNMAHHVVEATDPAAKKSRQILAKFGIDINSAANGILLPDGSKGSIYKGAVHKTSHSAEYSEYVWNKLKNCKSKQEVIHKLTEIKHELYSGKLSLQKVGQVVNKNIRS